MFFFKKKLMKYKLIFFLNFLKILSILFFSLVFFLTFIIKNKIIIILECNKIGRVSYRQSAKGSAQRLCARCAVSELATTASSPRFVNEQRKFFQDFLFPFVNFFRLCF